MGASNRTCGGCFSPVPPSRTSCMRCGRMVPGAKKRPTRSLGPNRGTCFACGQKRMLRPFKFGALSLGSFESVHELEVPVCSGCTKRSGELKELSSHLIKAAVLGAVFAVFGLLQLTSAPEFSFGHLLLFCMGAGGGFVLYLIARCKERESLEFIVAEHPKIVDLRTRNTVRLLDAEAIKAKN